MHKKTNKLVAAALMTALVCVSTMIIKIPSPLKGYINIGDCLVLTAGWIFSPLYGFIAAALGSATADVLSGYVIYAPATLLIKGIMAITAFYSFKLLYKKISIFCARIVSGVAAETIMIIGYYVFEGFLYDFLAATANIAANAIQGALGLALGVAVTKILDKTKIRFY